MIPLKSVRSILFTSLTLTFCIGVLVVIFAAGIGSITKEEAAMAMGALGVVGPLVGFIVKSLLDDSPSPPKTITAPQDSDVEVTVKSTKEA